MSRLSLRRSGGGGSVYNYPEHLNPFNEDNDTQHREINPPVKESKHKFWTFGRSRKKRSNSFSIKSTWNGLFGKKKEPTDKHEKRSTITTVSSTYKRNSSNGIAAQSPKLSNDQQEFDRALGTLTRRRKYTLDSTPSRCSSSLTINGDPARIYDGSPRDTTASIMGDLTPKPPARRFGQVSPRPDEKIPPLDYEEREGKSNLTQENQENGTDRSPIPPVRRSGNRSSTRRTNGSNIEGKASSQDVTLRDENENVDDEYVFKRFSQDAVRKSNLSINSCVSIGSTASAYSRKKRRAPQPPVYKDMECLKEKVVTDEKAVVRTADPIEIARVTENIDEMTKKSNEVGDMNIDDLKKTNVIEHSSNDNSVETQRIAEAKTSDEKLNTSKTDNTKDDSQEDVARIENENPEDAATSEHCNDIEVELSIDLPERLEIIKDVNDDDDVVLRQKDSHDVSSRGSNFSVKDEIEKIEKQIKALEMKTSNENDDEFERNVPNRNSTRLSLQENRRHFFGHLVDNDVKVEVKEVPSAQNEIHLVNISEPTTSVEAGCEPVKVIELHISEPIRQIPQLLDEVNPIPKPRRHNSLHLHSVENRVTSSQIEYEKSFNVDDRGKSF